MLNKKILAAAVAVAFTGGASATVTIDAAGTTASPIGTLTVATESFTATDFVDGFLPITTTGGANATDITFDVGFSVGLSDTRFVRVDLVNGEFGSVPALSALNEAGVYDNTDFNAVLSSGGVGESFVIFEISDSALGIPLDAELTVATATINATTAGTVTAQYRLYADALLANSGAETTADGIAATLANTGAVNYIQFASGADGSFTDADEVVATVESGFLEFSTATSITGNSELASLALITVSDLVAANTIQPDGAAFGITNLVAAGADLTISGDFSAGQFTLNTVNTCAAGTAVPGTLNDAESELVFSTVTPTATAYYFCVNIADAAAVAGASAGFDEDDGDVAQRSNYTVTVEGVTSGVEYSDDAGSVVYDTTTIEIPFVTTFADYNQRIYIVNTSVEEAAYSFTFYTEDGIEVEGTDVATGTVAPNEVTLIRAVDLVEITGGNRVAAVLDVELADGEVSAATQIVNRNSGETDTIILN
ncbi:hypothetical protein J3L16_00395 [Alteromonas sp. 5E99-2]|uniref:hypothetical protein n=1 Tax=Alteromonas sp. 5E99-2 TaxID=2817683 RepID=UPI001A98D901|nr:hypothetical protein [Alteromonas sp. 5E99-2]MBO1254136.1 hypothetical protein [Alteromonas sp. 5E99-2]